MGRHFRLFMAGSQQKAQLEVHPRLDVKLMWSLSKRRRL
jgi:hypothetical protein